jgi:predicted nucleic acid-binding protein
MPPGAAFLDANFLIALHFHTTDRHPQARALLASLTRQPNGETTRLVVSTRAIDEVLWSARILLHERDHGRGSWAELTPRERDDAWVRYSEEVADLGRILLSPDAPWEVLPVTADHLGIALSAIERHSLQPADASHYAVARRACDGCIVTNDRHFRQISDIEVIGYAVAD